MNASRAPIAGLLAMGLVGLVACGATSPVSSHSPAALSSARPSVVVTTARPSTSSTPRPTPTPQPIRGHDDLADEIEIRTLATDVAPEIYDFASDGWAVVFSSGMAPDAAPDAAPDLWQVTHGPSDLPELVWRNPERDHTLVEVGGDAGTLAFVDIPLTGERAWKLWLIPRDGEAAILLDEHPGDQDVSSLVPSFSITERQIVWTAFDRGPNGPVSQLIFAREPAWEPEILLERSAAEAELWLPSLYGSFVAFTEIRYSEDRSSDERAVYHMLVGDPASARRLDTSGRATMPVAVPGAVLWKEAEPGFNMFNWGKMFHYDLESERITRLDTSPQRWVNYPSAGGRFAAWWGADSFAFGVYDLVRRESRLIQRLPADSDTSVLRPHLSGDLLAWLEVTGSSGRSTARLRYAVLPTAAAERGR